MKIPSTLPVTAEQSRASRFQLGLTQAQVIEGGELPGYKLKQFETGRFVPDMPFLEKLRDFYASKGIEFSEAVTVTIRDEITPSIRGNQAPTGQGSTAGQMVPWFMVTDLNDEQGHKVFARILDNEERIAAILAAPVQSAFLGGWNEETQAKQRELFGALAENYILIARLQGRVFVKEAQEPARTHADLLAQFFASSPLAALAGAQPAALPASDISAEEEEDAQ